MIKKDGSKFNEVQKAFAYSCCLRGIANATFSDLNFRDNLKHPFTERSIVDCKSELAEESLAYMRKMLMGSPSRGNTLAFDIGTIGPLRTVNCLIVNTHVDAAFLIDSFDCATGATAVQLQDYLVRAIKKFYSHGCGHIVALCSDNASNVLLAAKLVARMPAYEHMLVFNCGCHVLNLVSETLDTVVKLDEEAIAELQQRGIIGRWCATRWWSKYDCFHEAIKNKLGEIAEYNDSLHPELKKYIAMTTDLRAASRSLERDRATMPLAIHVTIDLIRNAAPLVADAMLQRYLKFYAPNPGVTLNAFVSPNIAKVVNQCGISRESIVFHFVALVTRICSVSNLFKKDDIRNSVNGWCSITSQLHELVIQQGDTLAAFNTTHHSLIDPVSYVSRIIQSVAASEASAERSYSRFKLIRSGRYNLSLERSVNELVVACNPSPYSKKAQNIGEKRTRDEPTEDLDVTQVVEDDSPPPIDNATALHKYFIEPQSVPFLSEADCRFVIHSHFYMTEIFPAFDDDMPVVYWNTNCWASGRVTHADASSLFVKIAAGKGTLVFTISDAFRRSLQPDSTHKIKFM